MNGYIINFFKYGAIDSKNYESGDQMYMNSHESGCFVRSVVWSAFDRLEIREIQQFNEFRLSQYSEKKWVGERQFILLYEINPQKSNLIYEKSNDDRCLFAFHRVYDGNVSEEDKRKNEEELRFFGISIIDLSPEIHYHFYSSSNPGEMMHDKIFSILDEICEKNNIDADKICYELYGTLGGNDLIIIWLANQFRDVVLMIEALRKSNINKTKRPIISNISTIMGLRDINNPNIKYDTVDGNLNIRLTKKGTYSSKFEEELKDFMGWDEERIKDIETTLGEHDLSIRIDGIELSKRVYNDEGFIHMRNEHFFENIIQANTELSVKIDYENLVNVNSFKVNEKFETPIISLQEKERVYNYIEEITTNQLFDELQYLKETIWILYEEYLKDISSSFSYPWIEDIHYQFLQSIVYLKALIKVDDTRILKNEKYHIIRGLVDMVRQNLLHVSQANRLFFEIPDTHLKNTGSYSKVLRTYHGIVKQLLNQAYSIPKKEEQAEIIPFITFDVTPKITSTLLPELENTNIIIVNISLPYEALVDIPKYAKLLSHEIFHYIAPYDRTQRNRDIGIINISLFLSQVLRKYLRHIIEQRENAETLKKPKKICYDKINERCLKYVIDNFDFLTKDIEENKNGIWDEYFSSLDGLFSEKSMKFPSMSKVHEDMFAILDDITKDIKDRIDALKFEDFSRWIQDGSYGLVTKMQNIIKYALREAMADYFMIQVMDETTRVKSYYSLNLYYKKLLESNKRDERQRFRIAIITDMLFDDVTLKFTGKKKCIALLKKQIEENTDLEKENVEYVIQSFIRYYETMKYYRDIIHHYLESMKFSQISENTFKYNLERTAELFRENGEDDFAKSIQYIERFQIQETLGSIFEKTEIPNYGMLNRRRENRREDKYRVNIIEKKSFLEDSDYFYAWDIESLIKSIKKAVNKVTVSNTYEPVWFRGHRSCEFKLLPSLFRMKNNENKFYKKSTLQDVMEELYKAFKVKSFGAPEIYQRGEYTKVGTLASMQHYSVPTNILDWTPAAFVALYFAVEKYMIISENDRKKRKKPTEDAELWILNPARLNKARAELTARKMDEINVDIMPIPSISEDEEKYNEYIPFTERIPKPNDEHDLPIAVYVPYTNQRIKAQLGTFTMFSLDTVGKDVDNGKSVCFEDLYDIQTRYKKDVKDSRDFLARVRISKKAV